MTNARKITTVRIVRPGKRHPWPFYYAYLLPTSRDMYILLPWWNPES